MNFYGKKRDFFLLLAPVGVVEIFYIFSLPCDGIFISFHFRKISWCSEKFSNEKKVPFWHGNLRISNEKIRNGQEELQTRKIRKREMRAWRKNCDFCRSSVQVNALTLNANHLNSVYFNHFGWAFVSSSLHTSGRVSVCFLKCWAN